MDPKDMMNKSLIIDRLRGIAVGAAVGDALGMPLEFRPPSPVYDLLTEMVDGALPAGTFTDDTEMALALAESLLAHDPLDADDLVGRFLDWYRYGPPDIGIRTSGVLSRIAEGYSWQEATQKTPPSASNGSLMRNWPLAIAHWQDADQLLLETRLQSMVTHPDPDCVNACIFMSFVLHDLITKSPEIPPDAALRQAVTAATDRVDMGEDFRLLIDLAGVRTRETLANTGWVRHTVEASLWAVLTTRSFEEALVRVVNLGGDADTAGSVTGAIAGTLYGLEAIPHRWKSALRGEYPLKSGQTWFAEEVIALADRLSGLQPAR